MNDFLNNKCFKILILLFILISIIHIIYATITMRGMYLDGAFYMLNQLDSFSMGIIKISHDISHPRFFIMTLLQIPTILSYFILKIHNKFALMMIFSCSIFLLPLLVLSWNYLLTKRTQRFDIFFFSLFSYCGIITVYLIYGIVESILGCMLNCILWNYLAAKINYTKKDSIIIAFLTILLYQTFEYIIYIGIIFFIASIMYAKRETNLKNKITKFLIGIGSLGASIYNLFFIIKVPGEYSEIIRFFKESYFYFSHITNLNISTSIITLIFLIFIALKKESTGIKTIFLFSLICIINFVRLLVSLKTSISPLYESSFRTLICYAFPIMIIITCILDFKQKEQNLIKIKNLICIVLICGIFQTAWQIVNTYYWDKNIQYMKSELNKTQDLLYIPSEHEDISGNINPELRRYIPYCCYATMSILFSDTYEQKTLLLNYDEERDQINLSYRESLFVPKKNKEFIAIPWGWYNIKNEFWDLTKCAEALKKYDIEHNIESKYNE